MGRERLRDEVIGWGALLLFAAVGSTLIVGCDHGGDGPKVDPVFQAEVAQALDAIEQHGLAEWAEWGRQHKAYIINAECAGGFAYTMFVGKRVWIMLSSRWRKEIGVRDRGEILLEEIFHARTGVVSHTPDLAALLAAYNNHQEAR